MNIFPSKSTVTAKACCNHMSSEPIELVAGFTSKWLKHPRELILIWFSVITVTIFGGMLSTMNQLDL